MNAVGSSYLGELFLWQNEEALQNRKEIGCSGTNQELKIIPLVEQSCLRPESSGNFHGAFSFRNIQAFVVVFFL